MNMLRTFLLLIFATNQILCLPDNITKVRTKRLIGGTPADIGSYKYHALIKINKPEDYDKVCNGALIDAKWVITVAHCLKDYSSISIRLGSANRESGGTTHEISKVIMHDLFNSTTLQYDIAMIKLSAPVTGTLASPIDIKPTWKFCWTTETTGVYTVSGFGITVNESPSYSDTLQKETFKFLTQKNCFEQLLVEDYHDPDFICAAATDNTKKLCGGDGDSGAPLVYSLPNFGISYLVGLFVKSRTSCGSINESASSSLFIALPRYQAWIDLVMKKNK